MDTKNLAEKNLIVKHYAGSIAYGTNLPSSDVDVRGIFLADPINIRTPFFPVREIDVSTEEDTKLYELTHFMKLCLDCNPNIIETLWVDDVDILESSNAYEYLKKYRLWFLSSKIAFTTSGYAISQLKRIKGHNKWISNPQPKEPPKPKDYLSVVQWFGRDKQLKVDLNAWCKNHRLIPYGGELYGVYHQNGCNLWDHNGKLNTNYEGKGELDTPVMIVKFNKEQYKDDKTKHKNYWNWKENRNEKRSFLEEKYGYDTKHAMHLVRLLRMGVEALRDQTIQIKRPDAEELLSIRNGTWTYNEIVKYAESMEKEIKLWYRKTKLPKKPNIEVAAKVLMDVQDMVWS